MAPRILESVDTVIVGNGPSALILSYILHGNVPYYTGGHHDAILDAKLSKQPCLLNITPDLYEHFRSSLRYSTQALPINTLLDTLIRPNADTEANPTTRIEWRREPERAVPHVVLGNGSRAGGQWANTPVSASCEIGTLSYAEMLSLPGYEYAEHYMARNGLVLPDFERPTRREVAEYYAAYPAMTGIADVIHDGEQVHGVVRTRNGFRIVSHGIRCNHLVLASGTFSINIPPPRSLTPLVLMQNREEPLLVIGSGFSAADIILSAPPHREIIHVYRWSPEERPSPLKNCHYQAYPEYATVYRQMKLAASSLTHQKSVSPLMRRKSNPFFNQRDWASVYQGLPNADVLEAYPSEGACIARIRTFSGEVLEIRVGELAYVVGRRGSLDYLDQELLAELLEPAQDALQPQRPAEHILISGRTLRAKIEITPEVAPDVFVTGSLTGDSLVRHAFGVCAFVAGQIISDAKAVNGHLDGAYTPPMRSVPSSIGSTPVSRSPIIQANGVSHEDLHLDRRKLTQPR